MSIVCDCTIGDRTYTECDEFTMTKGNTYLVHSDREGFFLGTYSYASRSIGAFIFQPSTCYEYNYYGELVPSKRAVKAEVSVCMTDIIVRECR